MDAALIVVEDEVNGNFVATQQQQRQGGQPSSASSSRSRGSSNDSFTTADSKKSLNELEGKKLNRGISRATDNVNLVSQARSEIIVDTTENEFFIETPVCTFTLPDLTSYSPEFRQFLEKDLIALSTQVSLEQASRLNWWSPHCQKLWPLSTSGDGNCLLHAASLGMWGFHDRLLTLRKALYDYLSLSPRREALWRRWRRQQSILNQQAGLVYSEVEWRQEWNAIVNMASSEPRLRRLSIHSDHGSENLGAIYESLEEIHVLALAHVLRRSIIVVADTMLKDMTGEALAPIPFGGVYLPLECSPDECHRAPLLLAYDGGHFSALVSMDTPPNGMASAIPLADINGELLPLQFVVDPGNTKCWTDTDDPSCSQKIGLLTEYLDIIRIDPLSLSPTEESKGLLGSFGKSVGQRLRLKLTKPSPKKTLLCSVLHSEKRPDYHDTLIKNYLETAKQRFDMNRIESKVSESGGPLRYGAGNSQFYTEVDTECHERVAALKPQNLSRPDTTLYLGNSTFYEGSRLCKADKCTFYGNYQTQGYCSKCYKLMEPPLD